MTPELYAKLDALSRSRLRAVVLDVMRAVCDAEAKAAWTAQRRKLAVAQAVHEILTRNNVNPADPAGPTDTEDDDGDSECPSVGAVVFWHDPDDGACSGLRLLGMRKGDDTYVLTHLDGEGVTEALREEFTAVADCDAVGADDSGLVEYWHARDRRVYVTGERYGQPGLVLSDEEVRRVEAVMRQWANRE